MKTLIAILVLLYAISAKAEKLEGLFGVKIGEILTKELIIHPPPFIGFNYDDFLNHSADELSELLETTEAYDYQIKPRIPNNMFNKYIVTITPISKKIIAIQAITTPLEKVICYHLERSTKSFFIEKYGSDYDLSTGWYRTKEFRQIGVTEDIGTSITIDCSEENSFYQLSIYFNNFGPNIEQEFRDEIKLARDKLRARIKELAKLKLDTSGL